MAKFFCAVLILLIISFGDIFAIEQSTVADFSNDEEDIVSGLSGFVTDVNVHSSDAWVNLAKSIQSEFQTLKVQISRLEERHETYLDNSIEEIKNQVQKASNDTRAEISRLENSLESHNTYMSNSIQQNKRHLQGEHSYLRTQILRIGSHLESHSTYMNNSLQENKREMHLENMEMKNEFKELNQKLSSSRCPKGFNHTVTGFPKCYAVLHQTDWNTAQQRCRQLHKDAHLAVINGGLEQQIISEIIQNYNCRGRLNHGKGTRWDEYYWLGGQLQDISNCSSAYIWKPDNTTEMSIGYSNWLPGQPDCSKGLDRCLSMHVHGWWNDSPCSWSFCSVCEVMAYS